MLLKHSNQVVSWMERLDLPGPDLGLSAMRSMKNESMLFDNHQVSCSLLPQGKNKTITTTTKKTHRLIQLKKKWMEVPKQGST